MKKSVLFTIMLAICHVAFTKEVPVADAMQVARNFLVISNNKSLDTLYLAKTVMHDDQPLCYFLNFPDNKGYIVISAYDQVEPVLAFSFAHSYNESSEKSPAYIEWMENYYDQIRFVIENDLRADHELQNKWKLYRDDSKRVFDPGIKSVERLLRTVWGQRCFYNSMCPPDTAGSCGHVRAGCVAIAMAQIMKYHNWPAVGSGSHAYNHHTYGWQSANFQSTLYLWANMPESLTEENNSTATLIYHCGVSVEMNYGAGTSVAYNKDVPDALKNYFRYDPGLERYSKAAYSNEAWRNMIISDLEAGLPIFYRGQHETTGHAWVLDGYQGFDHFHMNWGWGGDDNAFFFLDNLNPGTSSWNENQWAIMHIKPKQVAPCNHILWLGNGGPANTVSFNKHGSGQWNTIVCMQNCLGKEQVYQFRAPHSGIYKISVTNARNFATYSINYEGCYATGWQCISHVGFPATYGSFFLLKGQLIYLLVDATTTNFTSHTFYIDVPDKPGTWTGLADSDWHNSENWSGNNIWLEDIDVIIPAGTPHKPVINSMDTRVKSLTIQNDAELTIGSKEIIVDRNMNIHGKLIMNHDDGMITVHGDVTWHSGSTAEFTANSTFNVYNNWIFRDGSNVNFENGWVIFKGSSSNSFIRNHSYTSSFSSLASSKTFDKSVVFSIGSTAPFTVKGNIVVNSGSGFRMSGNTNINLRGGLSSWGDFRSYGTLILTGNDQTIRLNDGNYLHHLTLSQNGSFTIHSASSDLDIRGNFLITKGVFNLQNRTIYVGGNWANIAGPGAFNPGTGRVVFNGSGNQYINSNEHFNILEANMGGTLRVNNPAHTVTCNSYRWTSGGLEAIQGTFTAHDLATSSLYGIFYVHPGGTINLHQGTAVYETVHLECHMEFNGGGNINVWGGYGQNSHWPFTNATLNMSGGVLDFKDRGIIIRNTGTLNTNITGGVIRTSQNFQCDRPGFDLGDGTLELYGDGNHSINITNQYAVISNVRINKATPGREYTNPTVPPEGIPTGDPEFEGERSGSILLNSDLHVSNNLEILSGTINVQQFALSVGNMLEVHGSINMPNANGEVFAFGPVRWHPGSTLQVSTSAVFKAYGNWSFLAGSNVNPENGTVMFMGSGNSQLFSHSNTSSFNNLSIYKTGGASTTLSSFSTQPLTVNNDIYVHTGASFRNHSTKELILKGNIESNGSFTCQVAKLGKIVLNGANHVLKMNTGDYFNNLTFNQSGTVTINNTHTDILNVRGNIVIENGVFNMQNRQLLLGGDWTNNIWPAGFDAGTGRVVFNSVSNQTIHTNENFNRLVSDMGGLLQINNAEVTVSCNQYDWKKGGINVIAGTFTANNLVQNGLYGEFRLQPQGTINIFNPGGWVDLVGQIYNYGGTMNISGDAAWWPYSDDAHLTMTGGIIDMKTCGIYVPAGYSWTYNITGGTIRSAHGFSSNDPNFNLEAGTFEYYGSNTVYIYQNTGLLFSIIINMSAKEGDELHGGQMIDSRSGVLLSDNSRSANVVLETDLIIDGNLDIKSGTLMANDKNISISGNWNNQIFPEGFNAGTGRVVFNGIYNQTCSSENFNILELNKAGGMLVIPHNTSCALYDWTSGGINVNGGTFTAHDLAQININGTYMVSAGGTINLHQNESHWVDLNANLYINSGTINIYGGAPGSESWWPDVSAFLYMSEGVLDFKDQGIFVRDFGDFASIITGGTIRTSQGFRNERTGFDLPAGTLELYGPDNANIYLTQGSSLHNLKINKSGGKGEENETIMRRDGTMFENIRGNSVTATSPIVLSNKLDVDDGTFSVNGFQLTTGGDVNVNGTLVVNPNANLSVGAGKRLAVNNQGKLYAVGVKGAEAVITSASKGHYKFDIESGGTLAATDAIFEYMDGAGIRLKPGALVDPAYPFYSCTFRNGAAGGRLLTLHNSQVFTVHNANFPANNWGGSHNVFKNLNSGHVSFINASGPFSGHPFEYDTHDRVSWGEMHLAVEPAESFLTASAGTKTIEVISDLPWTVSESIPWLTVSPMSGTGNGTLTVSYLQNTNESQRSGEITISSPNIGDAVATVTQDGTQAHYGILAVDPQSLEETHIITKGISEKLIHASNIGDGLLYFEVDITMLDGQQIVNSEWTVHVHDIGFGDEVSWMLRDKNKVVLLSGGPYQGMGYNDMQTVMVSSANEPLEFTISTIGQFNDNTPTYTVSCGDNIVASGWLPGGQMVIHTELTCDYEPPQWVVVNPTSGTIMAGGTTIIDVTFSSGVLLTKDNKPAYGSYHANIKFTGNNPHIQQPEVIVPVTLHYQEIPNNPQLWAEPPISYVTPPAGSTTYNIQSNLDWTASHEADWFSIDPSSGSGDNTITVIYEENTAMDARLAEISLSASGAEDVTLSIKQEGTFPLLTITPTEQNVGAPAGTTTFELESNTSWTVSGNKQWFYVSPTSGTGNGVLTVNYFENTSVEERSAEIAVEAAGETTAYASLIQDGADVVLAVEPSTQEVGSWVGYTSFWVQSNTTWTVSENCDWLMVEPAEGMTDGTLMVYYDENPTTAPRSCVITLSAEGVPDVTVTVQQDGIPIYLYAPSMLDVGAGTGTTTFDIHSNTSWTVSKDDFWFSLAPVIGSGNETITVNFEENTSVEPRSGTIIITVEGHFSTNVLLYQAGAEPLTIVEPLVQTVGPDSGSISYEVESNTSWVASTSEDWLSMNPVNGSGNDPLNVFFQANSSALPRTAEILLSSGEKNITIVTLIQEGSSPYLDAAPAVQHLDWEGGTTACVIWSNTDWTVSTSDYWLTVTPLNGTGDGMLTVDYSYNTTSASRTAEIILSAEGLPDVVLTIHQACLPIYEGILAVQPLSLSETHYELPDVTSSTLSVSNVGGSLLEFDISIEFDDGYIIPSIKNLYQFYDGEVHHFPGYTEDEEDDDEIYPESLWLIIFNETWTINPGESIAVQAFFNSENLMADKEAPPYGTYQASLYFYGDNPDIEQPELVVPVVFNFEESVFEPCLEVLPLVKNVDANAGTTTFDVASNTEWDATASEYWLSVDPTFGSGDGILMVNYEANTSASARSGEITVSAAGVEDVVVTLNQAGVESEVPSYRQVSDETIVDGQAECYDALNTIWVLDYIVEDGGAAYFVAGESIVFLPGTHAMAGSYLHAWITTTQEFCNSITLPLVVAREIAPVPLKEEELPMDVAFLKDHDKAFFRIFPNPTPGQFTLELLDYEQHREVVVHFFSMRGTLLQQHASADERELYFDLSEQPSGVYFVRVMAGGRVEVSRVVKR